VDGPATAAVGASLAISWVVTNTSAVSAEACIVKYYLSSDTTITTADRLLGQRSPPALAAGAANNGSVSLTLGATVTAGTHYLGAIADATNLVSKKSEINNTAYEADQITIAGSYKDLTVTSVDGPAAASSGGSITVTDTVKNANSASGAFTVTYYLSNDATITSADTKLGTRSVRLLAAGATSTASTALTLASILVQWHLLFRSRSRCHQPGIRQDETNNVACDAEPITIGS